MELRGDRLFLRSDCFGEDERLTAFSLTSSGCEVTLGEDDRLLVDFSLVSDGLLVGLSLGEIERFLTVSLFVCLPLVWVSLSSLGDGDRFLKTGFRIWSRFSIEAVEVILSAFGVDDLFLMVRTCISCGSSLGSFLVAFVDDLAAFAALGETDRFLMVLICCETGVEDDFFNFWFSFLSWLIFC